ncbi:MAG: cytochrome P450 [Sandaracinaceae bacterium]|nr:cytochrome P450 [Sandaracinaceae bacterium]
MSHRTAPGPKDHLGLTNIFRWASDQLGLLTKLKAQYGDVVQMSVVGSPWVLVSHPHDIETALVKNAKIMGRDQYITILQRTLGHGLLTSDGELWRRQRKLMSVAFTPKKIHGYAETMVRVGADALAPWRDGMEINVHAEMSRLTMEVVAEVLFGTGVTKADVETVSHAMEVINDYYANSPEAVVMLPEWVPTPRHLRMRRAVESIDAVLFRIIAARRASGEVKADLLGTLLAAQDDEGAGMTDRQLRDEAVTLFLAGHETTALALAHTLYLLSKYPDVARRVRAELAETVGDRRPGADDVKRLVYTGWVLKESMRLYPPAWTTGREATEDLELGGYHIPKGAQLLFSQWVVHRDPRWFPNPEAFDPERWRDEASLPRYAYFPFGGGPRTCIGNHFAMMEATLLLALVVQRYRVDLLPGERLMLRPSVTLRQKGPGLRARIFAHEPVERAAQTPAVSAA